MDNLYREEKFNKIEFPDFENIVKKKLFENGYLELLPEILKIQDKKFRLVREMHMKNQIEVLKHNLDLVKTENIQFVKMALDGHLPFLKSKFVENRDLYEDEFRQFLEFQKLVKVLEDPKSSL